METFYTSGTSPEVRKSAQNRQWCCAGVSRTERVASADAGTGPDPSSRLTRLHRRRKVSGRAEATAGINEDEGDGIRKMIGDMVA